MKKALAGARVFFLSQTDLGGRPSILFGLPIKLPLAFLRAEVVFPSAILRLILSLVLVHIHSANRVFGHKVSLSGMNFLP
jgi:hypothetical protein